MERLSTLTRTLHNQNAGLVFAGWVRTVGAAAGDIGKLVPLARQLEHLPDVEHIAKAAVAAGTTTDTAWASSLVTYQDAVDDFLEFVRPRTIVDRLVDARRIDLHTRTMRTSGGGTAAWAGEAEPMPLTQLSLETITFNGKKVNAPVIMTEESFRFATTTGLRLIRNELANAIAAFTNAQFISPTVAAVAGVNPRSVTHGLTALHATGSTVAAIANDLKNMFDALRAGGGHPSRSVLVMGERTALYLAALRTAQDVAYFRNLGVGGGEIWGVPVLITEHVSTDYGSPSASYIALIDQSGIAIGDGESVTFDVSRDASVQMVTDPSTGATTQVSLWQTNLIAVRAARYIDWERVDDAKVVLLDGVTY